MTEPKYNDFEDPKDYHAARATWLQARVEELEDSLHARQREVADFKEKKGYEQKNFDRVRAEITRLREALDQYKEDADEWKCQTCGEWQRPWQMYCDKEKCRAALKEKP